MEKPLKIRRLIETLERWERMGYGTDVFVHDRNENCEERFRLVADLRICPVSETGAPLWSTPINADTRAVAIIIDAE